MKALTFANVKGKNTIMSITSCCLFICQAVMTIIYLFGMVDYFGSSVNVFGAVALILSVANITSGVVFEYIVKCGIGIAYIVVAIIVVKNAIVSIGYFSRALFPKGEKEKAAQKSESSFRLLLDYVGKNFKACFIFAFLSVMASSDFTVGVGGTAVFIVGLLSYLGAICAVCYLSNLKLDCLLYRVAATFIMLTAFIVLTFNVEVPSLENLVWGLKKVFGGYLGKISVEVVFSAIKIVAVPVMYMILQFSMFSYISDIWVGDFYLLSKESAKRAQKIMKTAIAIACINVLINMWLSNSETLDIARTYTIFKDELPILFAGIALFISYKFEKFEELKTTDKANDSEQTSTAVQSENRA